MRNQSFLVPDESCRIYSILIGYYTHLFDITQLIMDELELDRSRIYEIGVQIAPTLGDDGAQEYFSQLKNRVVELGGAILQEGAPERIDLAYPIYQIRENKKTTFTESYFAWYKFELDASLIKTIEAELAGDLSVIRHIAFKTVKQNTYIPRKSPRRRSERSAGDVTVDELLPVVVDPIIEDDEIEAPSILDKKLDELTANEI
jgi:ribosomal protein S6